MENWKIVASGWWFVWIEKLLHLVCWFVWIEKMLHLVGDLFELKKCCFWFGDLFELKNCCIWFGDLFELKNCCIWLVICLNWKINTLRCPVCYVTKYWNRTKCTDKLLGAFAKFRIATELRRVCLSVRMELLGSRWTDFCETLHLRFFFWKSVEKFHVLSKSDRTNCTLCGDVCRLW
jgi:hypothetical protein